MRAGPLFGIVATLTLFLNTLPAQSTDPLKYVLVPTGEIQIDWQKVRDARQHVAQTDSVEAYAQTTNQVLQAWCHDINFQRDAMAFATTTIMSSGITDCPAVGSSEIVKIIVPSSRFSSAFGAYASDEMPKSINIYMRSTTPDGREALFSLAIPYLIQVYHEQGEYFDPQGFFPNFCLMCGCCYKPDGNGGLGTEEHWLKVQNMQ